ncbi:MAG: glycosyl transferase [Candidatus Thorarchaeota archaeon]|nr:MAG: glycosyl transferase [Candidatus Thorarchaeota archaeon]
MLQKRFIVVTPCKNEEKNLSNLIHSMIEQTIKPALWVILDDGSTDDTPDIIKEAETKYSWIKSIRWDTSMRDIGSHLSIVMASAFDFAVKYCIKNGIEYDYIGNVDGDIILEHAFFEKLINEFEKDPKLGIAGSGTQYIKGDSIIQPEGRSDEPSGGDMLIRRECFEECSTVISSSPIWDSALKAKARLRGWKTMRFEHVKAVETRDTVTVDGYWKGYLHHGKGSYQMNINPVHALIKSIKYLFKKPYYIGIAYMVGYLSDLLQRKDKIEDEEIRKYFRNKWRKYL